MSGLADAIYDRMKKKGGGKSETADEAEPPDGEAKMAEEEGESKGEEAAEGADGLALCDAFEARDGEAVEEIVRRICNYKG